MGHLRAIWVEEEKEWAMFFTYEHVHCVHTPETLERARCNPIFRYNIACLNLDCCPPMCEAAVVMVLLQYTRIANSWDASGSFVEISLGLLSWFPRFFLPEMKQSRMEDVSLYFTG